MYVLVVYDVEQKRVQKVCNLLRRYLHWVQNSAFEGELTRVQLERIKYELKRILDLDYDSVYFYIFPDFAPYRKEVLGVRKQAPEEAQFIE